MILGVVVPAGLTTGQAKRLLEVDGLFKVAPVSNSVLSPDGKCVAYIATIPNTQEDKNRSSLWVVAADGGTPRQLTTLKDVNAVPGWSRGRATRSSILCMVGRRMPG